MDFIIDGLASGRMVRILSVVDAYTRECLALEADTSLGSGRVIRVLEQSIEERGRPESLRSDNGPEFCLGRMMGWVEEQKIALSISSRATNAERIRRKLPRALARRVLNAHWFRTLNDVPQRWRWQQEYNSERPHSA